MPFFIKQNDTLPNLRATLLNADTTPIDLTAATEVRLAVKAMDGTPAWKHACDIITPAAGVVEYDFTAIDTAIPEAYQGEFEIEWPGTEIQTVPNDGYFTFTIIADLG
jgi:hypothetical protein